ncbi:radical SAM family heme chaperone HemW [Myxococcus stipitatus]|uniref:radical SAM family heme chaperone HemW n=1 Tax=Myxococcus stipitatus TaxID=83455 RepID=UPI003144E08B
MESSFPLYRYWSDYPKRDVEYVRWYPPTMQAVDGETILEALGRGPDAAAFYLHIPFCKDVCPYCPFNKYRMRDDRAKAFMDGVFREIDLVAAQRHKRGTKTSGGYFGGGTPTAMETPDLLRLIEHTLERLPPEPGSEVTMEANPDTVDLEKLRQLRASGINRISFGVQSFRPEFLKILGRTHGVDGAVKAIELARQAGFDNIAIDLIYRVPGQTVPLWEADLRKALELGVDHISTYCLFLDPGTRLYNETLMGHVAAYPPESEEVAMYQATQQVLGAAGFVHYTINDFARRMGRRSEHHLMNWQAPQRSYAGMGPGAFSYTEGDEAFIYCTIHSLQEYLDVLKEGRLPVRLANRLTPEERRSRYMVMGLRCLSVSKAGFRRRFGQEMTDVFGPPIEQLKEWGLLDEDGEQVFMTERGRHFASNVLKAFYTPANRGKPQAIGVELLAGKGLSLVSVGGQQRTETGT